MHSLSDVVRRTAGRHRSLLSAGIGGSLSGGSHDFEPNDSFSTAYRAERDERYSAYISEDDADFFSFITAHGSDTFDEVEISATGVGDDLKIGIAVYDPDAGPG